MGQDYHTLARAVDRVAIPFCIIDSGATHIKYANRPFGELFRLDVSRQDDLPELEEYHTSMMVMGFAPVEMDFVNFTSYLRKCVETREEFKATRKLKDGRYFRLEVYPDDGHDIVVTYTDVTDLEKAVEEARRAEGAKSEFMANMSHEIRTPMNGVLGMAQVLSGSQLTERQAKCVSVIERSGNALITIINDILDFSKMEAGQLHLSPAPFDMSEAVDDVMSLLGHSAREKGVDLIVNISPDIPLGFVGDMGRLRQILINLVGNAIKFTDKGFVKLLIHGETQAGSTHLTFEVEDTGIGIPASKISRIFNQFEQADNSTTRLFGGTGLGLTITRRLVEVMDGHISVTSEHGAGSIFKFSIALPHEETAAPKPRELMALNGAPILIVDDLEPNRDIISDQVQQLGGKPFAVNSAKAAINLMRKMAAQNFRFPVVISDFQMPEMDGLDFIRAVRADPSIGQTQIMVLSSVDLGPLRQSLAAEDVHHAVHKPASILDIHTMISDIMGRNQPQPMAVNAQVQPMPQPVIPEYSGPKLRILAADDDEVNRRVISGMLDSPGIDLTMADNGEEAVAAFRSGVYDVILMDIAMPIMDGVTAVRHIRRMEVQTSALQTPILATTAHAMEYDRQRFLEAGLDEYLAKPFEKETLLELINVWAAKPRHRPPASTPFQQAS